jgi:hypothetical protein
VGRRPIVVNTVIIGGYDRPPSVVDASPEVEFVLVSDEAHVGSPWKHAPVDRYWQDNKLTSGYIKTHPHLVAPPDAISVWVDANLHEIRIDPGLIRDLVKNSPVAAFPHLVRQTVSDEARVVTQQDLDDGRQVRKHMDRLRSLGFRDDIGLSATMLVVRDLADPRLRLFNQQWWQSIIGGSRRDQLGFEAASWATGIAVNHIDSDWREPNEWFTRKEHSRPKGRRIRSISDDQTATSRRFDLVGLPEEYPKPPYYEEEWTARDLRVIRALNAVVERSGELLEGNYCHMHHTRVGVLTPPDPRRSWKRQYLRRGVVNAGSLLEVGFNAGHSAAIALLENPELSVTTVDLASHSYTKPCAAVLAETFPGRIAFRWGDSRSVLQLSQGLRARDYDLVHIDGGHGADVFRHDLDWWMSTSEPGSRLLVDDSYVPRIGGLLEVEVAAARIRESNPGLPSSGENQLFVRL